MSPAPARLRLGELLQRGLVREVHGDPDTVVGDVRHDSRRIQPGEMFVAIEGASYDGASFVDDAVARGAVAVLADRALPIAVPVAVCDSPGRALGQIAACIHGDPSAKLPVVGVTGTNGKTTVTYLLESLLTALGARPAVIGTVSFRGPQGTRPATHTTPMADDLQRMLREALEAGASHVVMEVSSHALAQGRVDDVRFEVAALTNLSHDHLDYHGSLESYRDAKARLFRVLSPRHAVLNLDDALGAELADTLSMPMWRCSVRGDPRAELCVRGWTSRRQGLEARVAAGAAGEHVLASPLIGAHNLENLLVSLGCGAALGHAPAQCTAALREASGAPGRFERVPDPRGTLVLVDYAHTPDALARALDALRPLTDGRLCVVFGAGGNRDRQKRPLMGKAVAERADRVVLTSDNPRHEPPEAILAEIAPGLEGLPALDAAQLAASARGYVVEVDRARAIALALAAAGPQDTVLIAGKGHEDYQIVGAERRPFDDRDEARRALAALGGDG